MVPKDRRSRSVTTTSTKSTRPLSRASTTSAQSFDHQSQVSFQQPTLHHHHIPQHGASYPSVGSALLQDAQVNQLIGFNGNIPTPHHGHPLQQLDPNAHSFQAMAPQQSLTVSPVEADEKKKKGGAAGNATNDKELRELLSRNQGRHLKEVAAEVIATDRTSRSEKSKQLFAMIWLQSVCKRATTSVPRNRVYSKYAERCGTERVIPLNPASFGKLVRVIFPSIQTRRLGVRGESKYHYVDLELINDVDTSDDANRPGTGHLPRTSLNRQDSVSSRLDFNTIPRLPADTAAFPPQDRKFEANTGYFPRGTSRGRLYADPYSPHHPPANTRTAATYDYELRFPSAALLASPDSLDITLPDISPYLPARTDPDSIEALVALYRTHCTSLIDSVRYCKEKQFFRLFGSFHGTLTVPVQKLFAMPDLAPWIRECDFLMYQKMIRNVSQLTLQVAPAPVLKFLDNITKMLHSHISKVFQALPTHVLEAKLEPATVFAHLLRQMLRVNSTAHAAAVMLTVDDNRDRMWADWCAYVSVNKKRIVENELPQTCDHDLVLKILDTEIRGLLLPLKPEMWLPDGSFYQINSPDQVVDPTQETVIDRIAAFLTNLPSRFPDVPARVILHCINAIGSGVVREITVENGASFQGWWLTKVFVDEMAQWLASLGGFLSHSQHDYDSLTESPEHMGESMNAAMTNGGSGSNNDSRYSSIGADFGPNQSFMTSNGDLSMQSVDAGSQEINTRRYPEQHDQMSYSLDLDFTTSKQDSTVDDSGVFLEDLDPNFVTKMRSSLTQMPASVS